MKIYSEKTNKEYASVEDCLAAEKEYDEAMEAKKVAEEKALAERKAKQEVLANERKADAEKVEAARQAVVDATKAYHEAMNEFLRKHKSYHYTRHYTGEEALNAWNSFFDSFWL